MLQPAAEAVLQEGYYLVIRAIYARLHRRKPVLTDKQGL